MFLVDKFKNLIKEQGFHFSKNQISLVEKLALKSSKIEKYNKSIFKKLKQPPKSIYIYGDVGRGKTFIMDFFYGSVFPNEKKQRIHFHKFMHANHKMLFNIRKNLLIKDRSKLVENIANDIKKDTSILFLDELFINDIADAMLLGELFDKLLKNNIFIILTSNFHPDDLFKDGINREIFTPFIEIIKNKFDLYSLNDDTDYRFTKNSGKKYFHPLDQKSKNEFESKFLQIAKATNINFSQIEFSNLEIENYGRKENIPKRFGNILYIEFKDLCEYEFHQSDYLEICNKIDHFFIDNIKQIKKGSFAETRFINFIDIIYDNGKKLYLRADKNYELIFSYKNKEEAKDIKRTISRIRELCF